MGKKIQQLLVYAFFSHQWCLLTRGTWVAMDWKVALCIR